MKGEKQQVVFIHGGECFNTYEDYLNFLRDIEYDPRKKSEKWRHHLAEDLGENYEVFMPQMPCGWNAKYVEWKIFFEKLIPYLNDGAIFIGHSLGGVFLPKYFAENDISKSAGAVYLVSAPFWRGEVSEPTADFILPDSLERFERQSGEIVLYHSEDDPLVSFDDAEKYAAELPGARLVSFEDRGHFLQPEFPEIVADIKKNT